MLSSLSFVDATSNPANRVDASRDVLRSLVAAKRSTRPPVRLVSPLAAAWLAALERACLHHETSARAETRWRAPRPKRLTVPHNANAPPLRRS